MPKSYSFEEFLTEAARRGWSRIEAAHRLLSKAKSHRSREAIEGVRVDRKMKETSPSEQIAQMRATDRSHKIGRWLDEGGRVSECRRVLLEGAWKRLDAIANPPEEWIESTPVRSPVPIEEWRAYDSIEPDLTSSWMDDPEKPCGWSVVDWAAGTLNDYWWYGTEHTRYSDLRIDAAWVNRIFGYSDDEIDELIRTWPKKNCDHFWLKMKSDPKCGRKQKDIRDRWRALRATGRKARAKASRSSVRS